MKSSLNHVASYVLVSGLLVWLGVGCGAKPEAPAKPVSAVPQAAPVAQGVEKTDGELPDGTDPSSFLLDTGVASGSPLAPAALQAKAGWKHIKEEITDYAFTGDAVMQNNRLVVVARKGAAGMELYALTARGPESRATLAAVGGGAITAMKIVENSTAGVRMDVEFSAAGKAVTVGVRLVQGDLSTEVYAGAGLTAVKVHANTRVAVVPNYFVDDMVFNAASVEVDQVLLPMEQFFVCPLEGANALMMCVCESDQTDAAVLFEGAGAQRKVAGAEIQVVPEKKTWIAFMESAGNSLVRSATDASGEWAPPYPARWRVNVLKEGGFAQSKPFKPGLLAELAGQSLVVYPLERDSDTPLAEFCMRDIMKNTLGVGPCEYVIQANNLANDATPHQVAVFIEKQFEKGKDKAAADDIRKQLDLMVEHVASAQAKIDTYGSLAEALKTVLAAADLTGAGVAVYAKGLKTSVDILEKTVNMSGRTVQRADQARQYAAAMLAQVGRENGLSEVRKVGVAMSALNEAQDQELSASRMAALWLKQQSRMMAGHTPATQPLADKIVGLVNAVMKPGAGAPDHVQVEGCGSSCKAPVK